ncbi:Uncharacterized protein JF73_17660 (plasmid) [Lactobacillus helsingborgensis]|uniref:Uncharacterized protein n=2 Tax=Lactobacillus TaxID=1578 RepID=A0AA47B5Y8_9LACO|nr:MULTISPECIES: hypothetical protein [Lactobacillus]KJY54751.1 Uncharacterized protein JF74_19320 [Lactobacillus melliventris]KJY60588.1 Uncharacterized protein JF73_17660 [Lactobacillus helsingborgensis]UZX30633.1 hypothetical protein LDX53_09105 [Lactobacillus helsingborgensis]UZX32436.1 hypothetical protein LDX52_09700 [Lactobacillus helsingborgensis]
MSLSSFLRKNKFTKDEVDNSESEVNETAGETDNEDMDYSYVDLSNEENSDEEIEQNEYDKKHKTPSSILGQPSLFNIIGPSYWSTDDFMQDEFVMRENMRSKTYGIAAYVPPSGYPRTLDTTVFQDLLAQGNVDVTLDIVPQSRRFTMRNLSNMLNIIEANAEYQKEKGQTFQERDNIAKYSDIDNFLDQVQFDENRMYDVAISVIVYGSSDREVNQNFGIVADLLANENLSITPYAKRQKSGYLTTIPIGARISYLNDTYRNVDRKALAVMDVARNASGRFNGGIPFGNNQATPSQNTEFLNIFGTDTHRPINYNMGIVGEAGSGKSAANKIKMAREISILGLEHRSIDPDGEYILLAKRLGQLNLTITANAQFVINPCALSLFETPLEEETMTDENGQQLSIDEMEERIRLDDNDHRIVTTHKDGGRYIQQVNISQMLANIKGFVNVILTSNESESKMSVGEEKRLEDAVNSVVNSMGITTDPNSLFSNKAGMVDDVYHDRLPKLEPTLTDIYKELEIQNTDENGEIDPKVERLMDALKLYLRDGKRPIFDGQTYFGKGRSQLLNDYKYVNFNISQLDGSIKRVAYYVITQYLWERWMKNPAKAMVKKVLDADEILQFIDDPEMSSFFETIVRRDRKRNGSITWLTQDIERFQGNPQAKALVTNSEFMFVLATKPEHRRLMKETVDLTDGALDILTGNPEPGEGILRQEGESIWIRTNPSLKEMQFVESNRAIGQARKHRMEIDAINKAIG